MIQKTFDLKKCARALHNHPGSGAPTPNPDSVSPKDLTPCMFDIYVEMLRQDKVTIANIDFADIGECDIDDLENALYYSPANDLFAICAHFAGFRPHGADKRSFI